VAVLAVLGLMLTPGGVATAATLTVEVTNNTANGATVVGDEATVQLYKGQSPIESLQAKVGEDGKAIFENVPTGKGIAVVPRVKHQDMAFKGRPLFLTPATEEFSTSVQVFDVSTDTSQLSVGMHHIMVAVREQSLGFTEYMQLTNASDMAVTGSQRDGQNRPVVIEVRLPEGSRDLACSGYLEQNALVITAEGFYDTLAVPPGEHQVTFSYKVDIDRNTIPVAKAMTLPTADLMIFWEQGQGRLEGLGEPTNRLTNDQGVPIEYYRRSDLKPGDRVSFQIAGFNVRQSDSYTWIVLAAVFVVVVVVALLRLRPKPAATGQENA
jgi:hypothetical protein